MYVGLQGVPQYTSGDQTTTLWDQFSPFVFGFQGLYLGHQACTANAFIQWPPVCFYFIFYT